MQPPETREWYYLDDAGAIQGPVSYLRLMEIVHDSNELGRWEFAWFGNHLPSADNIVPLEAFTSPPFGEYIFLDDHTAALSLLKSATKILIAGRIREDLREPVERFADRLDIVKDFVGKSVEEHLKRIRIGREVVQLVCQLNEYLARVIEVMRLPFDDWEEEFDELEGMAERFLKEYELPLAELLITEYIKRVKASESPLALRGRIRIIRGDYAKAMRDCHLSYQDGTNNMWYEGDELGKLFEELNRFRGDDYYSIREAATEVLAETPENLIARLLRGWAAVKSGAPVEEIVDDLRVVHDSDDGLLEWTPWGCWWFPDEYSWDEESDRRAQLKRRGTLACSHRSLMFTRALAVLDALLKVMPAQKQFQAERARVLELQKLGSTDGYS